MQWHFWMLTMRRARNGRRQKPLVVFKWRSITTTIIITIVARSLFAGITIITIIIIGATITIITTTASSWQFRAATHKPSALETGLASVLRPVFNVCTQGSVGYLAFAFAARRM